MYRRDFMQGLARITAIMLAAVRLSRPSAPGTSILTDPERFPAEFDTVDAMTAAAVGEASMCWEFPDRAGVFDTSRALRVSRQLSAYVRSLVDFHGARRLVCDEMSRNDGLRLSYQARVARVLYGRGAGTTENCDALAAAVMDEIFAREYRACRSCHTTSRAPDTLT